MHKPRGLFHVCKSFPLLYTSFYPQSCQNDTLLLVGSPLRPPVSANSNSLYSAISSNQKLRRSNVRRSNMYSASSARLSLT